jgi:hypothetical protein
VGLNLGVWDWKTKHLARDVLQKPAFAEIGFLMIPGSFFCDFGIFVALEIGLKCDDFSYLSWGTTRSCDLSGVWERGGFWL